jgi:cytochrome c5
MSKQTHNKQFGLRMYLAIAMAIGAARAEELPDFPEPALQAGKTTWVANCKLCHASDLSDAPQVKDHAAWAPRIAQGKSVLYAHALNGFAGPKGTEMPARGGNAQLTDEEVRAAVDYMVALVTFLKKD